MTSNTNRFGAVILAAALAAGLLVALVAGTPREAEAAFPGTPNAIAFVKYGSDARVFRMGSDGFGPAPIAEAGERSFDPAWSSDGNKIAFTSAALNGSRDVWRMDADGQNEVNLTKHPAFYDIEPAWFPGGNKVAFTSDRTGNFNVFAMTFDAAGNVITTTQLTKSAATDSAPAVSPDGKKLAFTSDRDGDLEIYVIKANAPEGPKNRPVKLTSNSAHDGAPNWSPSGKKIAFNSNRTGNADVFVMNADGTKETNLTKNAANDGRPAYSPDGKEIAFDSSRSGDVDVWRMRADGANPVNVSNDPNWPEYDPDWQPT
jgi:Tol biopolymer transport system component